jgi:prepilin-type N-terminal cleavage/methylation domain-containing protein
MSECTNQKGFSMIELLVALAILMIGTLAVATMLMRSSDNSIFANRSRGGDTTALELVEAVKGEIAQTTFDELSSVRIKKEVPYGPILDSGKYYEYLDASSSQTGTAGTGNYVQRLGIGNGYIYKWRVEDRKTDYSLPQGTLKLEVTVGWNDRKYEGKYPCTGDPEPLDPLNPITGCARRSRITNWIIESKK